MLQFINTAGLVADLYPDTSITIERNNPLFVDDDKFFEDITYGFTMPATENNKEFFSSGHLIEAENHVYELPVQTIVGGSPLFAGTIAYSFIDGDFNTTLKVNFGAIANKVKSVKVGEIFTDDAVPTVYTAAYMKTVCQNPLQYPFSFFPVYNEGWRAGGSTTQPIINPWDHAAQTFSLISADRQAGGTESGPYWKLKQYLVNVMQYLGFSCEGTWMDDAESDKIYIYTRFHPYQKKIYESGIFLPAKLTIGDFFKIVKERFRISFSFDLFAGSVKIQSATSLLASTKTVDISEYITDINEIFVNESEGFIISLEADKQDELFKDTVNTTDNNYIPTQRIIIGNGENEEEFKSSTLKTKEIANYSMPATKQLIYNWPDESIPDYPLRFIRYEGMKTLPDGKIFPQASAMELTLKDAEWYRFKNDSKALKVTAAIPPYLLFEIDGSTKIGVTSKENAYMPCIIEKLTYNLEDKELEYIDVNIECRTIVANYSTPVYVEPVIPLLEKGRDFKCYFAETGFANIEAEIYYEKETSINPAGQVRIDKGVFVGSTDKYGVGGVTLFFPRSITVRNSVVEFRVRTAKPKYVLSMGIKHTFTERDGYWFAQNVSGGAVDDGRPYFLVF